MSVTTYVYICTCFVYMFMRCTVGTKVVYNGLTLRPLLVSTTLLDTEHCVHSLQVMRTQLETLGEEFKLAGKYLMERTYYALRLGP